MPRTKPTTNWTERTKPSVPEVIIYAGTPIGLLLALTYPSKINNNWTERTKPTTNWT